MSSHEVMGREKLKLGSGILLGSGRCVFWKKKSLGSWMKKYFSLRW